MARGTRSPVALWTQQFLSFATMFSFMFLATGLQNSAAEEAKAKAAADAQAQAEAELIAAALQQAMGDRTSLLSTVVQKLDEPTGPGLMPHNEVEASPVPVISEPVVVAAPAPAPAAVEVDAHSGGS